MEHRIVNDESLFDGLAFSFVGMNFLLRFSPKLKKAKQLCRNSFDGNTLVATSRGLQAIRDIQIGDKVWAYNENNQTKSLQEVTHLIKGKNFKNLIDIHLANGEIITATDNHPFWEIDTRSWLKAEELNSTSLLMDINENNISINNLRSYSKDTIVYNLAVDNDHTYFVGNSGVLGHNCDIDTVMSKIVSKVPKKYCKNGECKNFAKDLMKRLDAEEIPYKPEERRAIGEPYVNIWSDKLGDNISENGYHIGVRVGDKIYDNNNPMGVHYQNWYHDLIAPLGFK